MSLSFILPLCAGFSTLIGYFLIYKKESNNIIVASLAFASGVMICVSIIDLIPESIKTLCSIYKILPTILISLIGLNIGVIISLFLDRKINYLDDSKLYKIGIISMIAIIIHNIPEGIITYMSTTYNTKLGIDLSIAIALHNIPEGISIAVPIYYATKSKLKAFVYTLVSALSEPFGALLSFLFLKNYINPSFMGILYSIIAGLMIYIGIFELLKESVEYKKYLKTLSFFVLGVVIMFLSIYIF